MKTVAEVTEWIANAAAEYGDPSTPVCHLFFRWQDELKAYAGDELACGMASGDFVLWLGPDVIIPMPVELALRLNPLGELEAYGADCITPGVWSLHPSLNYEGLIHAFVTLHGVPDPAPWEKRIVLARAIP